MGSVWNDGPSEFPPQAGLGDVQLSAVFGDGAAGNFVALFREGVHEVVVGKGIVLVFVVHQVAEDFLDLAGGDFLALAVFQAFGFIYYFTFNFNVTYNIFLSDNLSYYIYLLAWLLLLKIKLKPQNDT